MTMSMTASAKRLLWIDLETTGTDEDVDDIIEIGAIITTPDFALVEEGAPEFQSVVCPRPSAFRRMMDNEVVREMHEANGLLEECRKAPTLWEVQERMLDWLGPQEGSKPDYMIAGSGVSHFDRRFVDKWLGRVSKRLVYSALDVGIVRRFLRISGVEIPEIGQSSKTHRALDDIRLHLEEAQLYKKIILEGR